MSESNVLGIVSYGASFTGEDGSGAAYTVALHRASDVSAPNSTCTLPAAFTIGTPATGSTFSRAGQDIVVNYGQGSSGDAVSYSLSGSCISSPSGGTTPRPRVPRYPMPRRARKASVRSGVARMSHWRSG